MFRELGGAPAAPYPPQVAALEFADGHSALGLVATWLPSPANAPCALKKAIVHRRMVFSIKPNAVLALWMPWNYSETLTSLAPASAAD